MAKRLYVGNLPFTYDSDKLRELFSQYGEVVSAQVMSEPGSNRSRGFGFVEFVSSEAADKAIADLNGRPIDGRALTVNEARERPAGGGGERNFGERKFGAGPRRGSRY